MTSFWRWRMIKCRIITMRIQDTSMIVLHLPQHKIITMVTGNGITMEYLVLNIIIVTT